MKILIVRNSPTKINLDSYNVQEVGLAKALIKKGHEVGIVFYSNSNYYEKKLDNINIYYVPAKKFLNYALYFDEIYNICKQYDIIQVSEYNQIMSYNILKRFPNKTVIYHGPYYRKNIKTIINNTLFDLIYLKKYLKLKPTIMTKSFLAQDFLNKKGFKKITTVGVGLDDSKFKNSEEKNLIFEENYNDNNINLLCIATIEKRKNTLFLLKFLKELNKTKKNYKLFLIGASKQKYKEKCMSFINKNNLQNKVCFIDKASQKELPSIYKKCDYLLLASSYEIFGMVLLEASYFKLPILSSLNGGSSYLLDENKIVKDFNTNEWVNKLLHYKKSNIKSNKILWNDKVDNFIKIYKEKLNEK